MARYVAITRWTPQTARALFERWMTVINGTAPKAVLDAFTKVKIITQEVSLSNRFAILLTGFARAEKKVSIALIACMDSPTC